MDHTPDTLEPRLRQIQILRPQLRAAGHFRFVTPWGLEQVPVAEVARFVVRERDDSEYPWEIVAVLDSAEAARLGLAPDEEIARAMLADWATKWRFDDLEFDWVAASEDAIRRRERDRRDEEIRAEREAKRQREQELIG